MRQAHRTASCFGEFPVGCTISRDTSGGAVRHEYRMKNQKDGPAGVCGFSIGTAHARGLLGRGGDRQVYDDRFSFKLALS